MHMAKVRTTINLNEEVVRKAKNLGINISAVAEMGIINYIKELENIGRENDSYNNNTDTDDDSQSNVRNTGKDSKWTCRDLNPRPPPCQGGDLPS